MRFDKVAALGDKAIRFRKRDCTEPWRSSLLILMAMSILARPVKFFFVQNWMRGNTKKRHVLQQHYKEFWNNRFWQELRRTNAGKDRTGGRTRVSLLRGAICWGGPCNEKHHILDWSEAEKGRIYGCNLHGY